MIFSLIPLAALTVAPALGGTISARKEDSIQARDWAPWTPGWSWPGTNDTCHPSIPEDCPCLTKVREPLSRQDPSTNVYFLCSLSAAPMG